MLGQTQQSKKRKAKNTLQYAQEFSKLSRLHLGSLRKRTGPIQCIGVEITWEPSGIHTSREGGRGKMRRRKR